MLCACLHIFIDWVIVYIFILIEWLGNFEQAAAVCNAFKVTQACMKYYGSMHKVKLSIWSCMKVSEAAYLSSVVTSLSTAVHVT